jgi:hypothetical protein
MPDDLDQLIRAAMKTLDEEVPSGYFEALPNRTLARLEGSMQHGSSGTTDTRRHKLAPPVLADEPDTSPVSKQPIMDQERDEDSGLHDIRNLAQSTKQRLSRKITSPPVPDDLLASSSGAFKNIALPQPAKMVSLPTVDELPSKAEVAAAEKAAKKAAKEAARESKRDIPVASAAASVEAPLAGTAASIAPARQAFSLPSQQRKSSKGPILTIMGLGLAAAAGGVIYMQMNKQEDAASVSASAPAAAEAKLSDTATATGAAGAGSAASAEAVAAQPAPVAEPMPAAAPVVEAPKDEMQLATDDAKGEDKADSDKKGPKERRKPAKGAKTKVEKEEPKPEEKPEVKKPEKPVATKGGEGEGEPSFDALLKEAGVSDQKKEVKPKLDKKSLTSDDFKKGMSSPAAKAKGCYKGTQGTAMIKLTVAPSGQISKVTVSGDFAGKAEGTCVENAIKAASFPPWDGGPQSFTYSVLLSD